MAQMKFIKTVELDIKEGDVLIWRTDYDKDCFVVGYSDGKYILISIVDGIRFTKPRETLEELIEVLEKDGRFEYFGKIDIDKLFHRESLNDL